MALFDNWLSGLFGRDDAAQTAPAAQLFPEQAADNPMLSYFSGNLDAAKQAAAALMGEAPKPDYRMALAQLGLGILSQPGGQPLANVIGRAGEQALPLFAEARQKPEDWMNRQRQLTQSLLMSGYEDEKARQAAAAERVADMEDFQYKEQYKAFLEANKPVGLQTRGDLVIDGDAYQANIQAGMDERDAFSGSIVYRNKPALQDNLDTWRSLDRNAASLEAMGDPDAPRARQLADDLYNKLMATGGSNVATAMIQNEDGLYVPVSAPVEQLGTAMNTVMDYKKGNELEASQEATANVLDTTARMLDLAASAPVLGIGGSGDVASTLAAWGKAATEAMSPATRARFNQDVGDDPSDLLNRLRQSDEARTILTPEYLNYLSELGQTRQQVLTNMLSLAYATATAREPGGRLSESDVALALRTIGLHEDDLFQDPARMRTALMETARQTLVSHQNKVRFAGQDPSNDAILKNLNDYGFQWSDGKLTYGEPPAPAPAPTPATAGRGTQPTGQLPPDVVTGPGGEPVTQEQFNALPVGAKVLLPDGTIYTKQARPE